MEKKTVEHKKSIHSLLNPSHTFDNFMVGGSNQFAYAAVKSVSEKAGQVYNPLFIYGGVGLGKTHLMQAAGNVFQNQGKLVIYITLEQFLNDFSRALRNKTMERFREKYRKCDVLLVDDIQFLSNKELLQEEFFHTFEALRGIGKQIILTADKHPKKIAGLEERLQSRFEWGLVADIQPPELETKIAIIRKKCELNNIRLPEDVVTFIATSLNNNIREIEGMITQTYAMANVLGEEINLDFTKEIFKEQIDNKEVDLNTILTLISKEFNLKPSEVTTKSRKPTIVLAKRTGIYLARELTKKSTTNIAKISVVSAPKAFNMPISFLLSKILMCMVFEIPTAPTNREIAATPTTNIVTTPRTELTVSASCSAVKTANSSSPKDFFRAFLISSETFSISSPSLTVTEIKLYFPSFPNSFSQTSIFKITELSSC